MGNIVAHYKPHEQQCNQYSHCRIDEVEIVAFIDSEVRCEQRRNQVNESLEYECGKASECAYEQREDYDECLLLDVLLAPKKHVEKRFLDGGGYMSSSVGHLDSFS